MRRVTKIIVAVVAVLALLVITCPSKEKHKRVIRDQLTTLVKNELPTENIDTENPFVKAISAAGVQLLDSFIDKSLEVKNYGLFSVAKAGQPAETISIGVLGIVFLSPKEKNISLGTTDFKYTIDDGLDIRLQ